MRFLVLILSAAFAFNAFAARQKITCEEVTKSKSKHTLTVDFDPSLNLETMWKKSKKLGDYIETYKLGEEDKGGKTTARLNFSVPGTKKQSQYSGKFSMTDYYEVNSPNEAGGGYSYKFGNKAYRSFHGHDENGRWDTMFYFPESALGQNAEDFPGLITMQMDIMDQGYYHIDMKCSSKVR